MAAQGSEEGVRKEIERMAREGRGLDESDTTAARWIAEGREEDLQRTKERWGVLRREGGGAARCALAMANAQRDNPKLQSIQICERVLELVQGCDAVRRARIIGAMLGPCSAPQAKMLMERIATDMVLDLNCKMIREALCAAWNMMVPTWAVDTQTLRLRAYAQNRDKYCLIISSNPEDWLENGAKDLLLDCMCGDFDRALRACRCLHYVRDVTHKNRNEFEEWTERLADIFKRLNADAFPFFILHYLILFDGVKTGKLFPEMAKLMSVTTTRARHIMSRAAALDTQDPRWVASLLEAGPSLSRLDMRAARRGANPTCVAAVAKGLIGARSSFMANTLSFDNKYRLERNTQFAKTHVGHKSFELDFWRVIASRRRAIKLLRPSDEVELRSQREQQQQLKKKKHYIHQRDRKIQIAKQFL